MKGILTLGCFLLLLFLNVTQKEPAWKTFSNKTYGIEFKYPANWWIEERTEGDDWIVKTASKGELYAFSVRVSVKKPASFVFVSTVTEKLQLAGETQTAYLFPEDLCPQQLGECPGFYIPVQVKDKWYLLEGRRGIDARTIARDSVYRVILSTVRFIE